MATKSKRKSASTKAKRSTSKVSDKTEAQRVAFAKKKKVTTPFFSVEKGKIFRTSDGKAYPQHVGFFEDGGARDWSNVTQLS